MAGPGYLFGRFSLLEARVIPRSGGNRPPGRRRPAAHAPVGRATCTVHPRPHGKGLGIGCRALILRWRSREGVTPPLPPPPRLRPRPPLRWAWDRAADPWQGPLRFLLWLRNL